MFAHPRPAPPPNGPLPNNQHARQYSVASSAYSNANGSKLEATGYDDTGASFDTTNRSHGGVEVEHTTPETDEKMDGFYSAFCNYLYGSTEVPTQTSNKESSYAKARQKLLKLPLEQFVELATDVHDEMSRRNDINVNKPRFLPKDNSFHPKRNQGREKLSILSPGKFRDLCTDILYGIEVRCPNVVRLREAPETSVFTPDYSLKSDPQAKPIDNAFSFENSRPKEAEDLQNNAEGDDSSSYGNFSTHHPFLQTKIVPKKGTMIEEDEEEDESDELYDSDVEVLAEHEVRPGGHFSGIEAALEELNKHTESMREDNQDDEHSEQQPEYEQEYEHDEMSYDHGLDEEQEEEYNVRDSILDSIAEEEDDDHDDGLQHNPIYTRSSRFSQEMLPPSAAALSAAASQAAVSSQEHGQNQLLNTAKGISGQLTPPESAGIPTASVPGYFDNEPKPMPTPKGVLPSLDFADIESLQSKIKDRDEQIDMLISEGSRMDESINQLETQLAESEDMKSTLVEENGRLHELVGVLELAKEELATKTAQLETEKKEMENELQQKVEQLQDQIRERDENLASAEAHSLTLNEKYADYLNKQNEFDTESSKLNKTVAELQSKVEERDAQLLEHSKAAEQLKQKSQEHEESIDRHLATINAQEETIAELKRSGAEKNLVPAAIAGAGAAAAATGAVLDGSAVTEGESGGKERTKEELQRKYDKLKKEHSKLSKELEQQQKVTEQVREEASAFLEEMRTLASNNASWDSSQNLNTQIKTLRVEVQEWKSRYLRAKSQVRNARSSTYGNRNLFQPSMNQLERDSPYYDELKGMIQDTSVHKFQIAMEDFLIKSRTDAGNLLDHLHYLVVAARGVTQDITDSAETHDRILQSELAQCTSMVSTTANHLITTTRNHTTSGGLAPLAVLDAAASDLSSAVIELVKIAKIRPQEDGPQDILPPRPDSSGFENGARANNYESTTDEEVDDPKGLGISTNEVDSAYMTARSTPGIDEVRERKIVNAPVKTRESLQPKIRDSIQKNIRESTDRWSKSELLSPKTASKEVKELTKSVSTSSSATPSGKKSSKRYASEYNPTYISPGRFNVADPDNTVAELQGYLEQKTLGVIDAIQNLLTGIRGNSTMGELRPYLSTIISSVNKMIEATGNSMEQTRNQLLKDKGSYILQNLEDCVQRMDYIRNEAEEYDDSESPNRHLKQRLAGISFDMTKCTKELVKTVEEVSLTAHIMDIDDQLAGR